MALEAVLGRLVKQMRGLATSSRHSMAAIEMAIRLAWWGERLARVVRCLVAGMGARPCGPLPMPIRLAGRRSKRMGDPKYMKRISAVKSYDVLTATAIKGCGPEDWPVSWQD